MGGVFEVGDKVRALQSYKSGLANLFQVRQGSTAIVTATFTTPFEIDGMHVRWDSPAVWGVPDAVWHQENFKIVYTAICPGCDTPFTPMTDYLCASCRECLESLSAQGSPLPVPLPSEPRTPSSRDQSRAYGSGP